MKYFYLPRSGDLKDKKKKIIITLVGYFIVVQIVLRKVLDCMQWKQAFVLLGNFKCRRADTEDDRHHPKRTGTSENK